MSNRRYTGLVMILSIVLIAVTAVFNTLVDPYSIFSSPRVAGFNNKKPYTGDRGRTGKVHQVRRIDPATLIVGNSRPEMGLNPEHQCWSDQQKPVFNFAVPGLTVYKQVRYTQHAIAGSQVRLILMGVDFSDFIEAKTRDEASVWPTAEESALRLSVDAMGQPRPQFKIDRFVDRFKASVSLGALADSVSTVTLQRRKFVETRSELGFNPAQGLYIPIVNSEGVEALFTQKNREMALRLAPAQTLFNEGTNWSAEFEALDRLGRQVKKEGIELVLFINPYHAEYLLLLDQAGLWSMFEQWKRKLVRTAGVLDIPVWDFSVFDRHATETIADLPRRGQSLSWFWEPAHYREELGSLMLSRMLPGMPNTRCNAEDARPFGVALNKDNLPRSLAEIRTRRDAFVAANPAVRIKLEKLFADELSKKQRSISPGSD